MDQITVLRRFNRSYTQRIGALEDSFLGMGLPLPVIRVLFEAGAERRTAQELRELLGHDSGYLSRLLRTLEERGLVVLTTDPADRRRRLVELTPAGQELWEELERRSDARAQLLLDPLTERQRSRLIDALATADLLVRAATVSLRTVDPASPQARTAVRLYLAELRRRFDAHDPGPPREEDEAALRAPQGAFVVALSDGGVVAAGAVRAYGDAAEVKRLWVDDGWRGAGLGSRMLRHLEGIAGDLGFTQVRLDTNASLTEAMTLYRHAGYRSIERYNDNPDATHFFAKDLG